MASRILSGVDLCWSPVAPDREYAMDSHRTTEPDRMRDAPAPPSLSPIPRPARGDAVNAQSNSLARTGRILRS